MVDKCGVCYLPPSGSHSPRRTSFAKQHDTKRHLGRNHLLLGIINHRIFWILALYRGTSQHQGYKPYYSYVFERPSVLFFLDMLPISYRLMPAGRTLCTSNTSGSLDIQRYTHRVGSFHHRTLRSYHTHSFDRNRGASILVILGGTM